MASDHSVNTTGLLTSCSRSQAHLNKKPQACNEAPKTERIMSTMQAFSF